LTLSTEARSLLHAHGWPGNVRELEHCIESAVVLAAGPRILPSDLPLDAPRVDRVVFTSPLVPLRDLEDAYLRWAADRCDGNRSEAARLLGIGRNTLARHLKD
jgi:DNA-binding NtrC family response regulator